MRNILGVFFLLVNFSFGQTIMQQQEIITLKKKVKEQAKQTETITSNFVQYKHLDFLTNDIVTSGKLAFKAPNLVKWEYVKPFEYSVLFKNENLYINDEGKKSDVNLSSSKLFKKLNHLIINSVKGDMFNDNEFAIAYYKEANNYNVHFDPKNEKIAKYIKQFQILFDKQGEVQQIKMIEPSNDYTKIVFENRVRNQQLSDAVFTH